MFVEAIDKVANFTRPVHTLVRTYTGKKIIPGAATLFFVNELGYAVTCKHVVDLIIASEEMKKTYGDFRTERSKLAADNQLRNHLKGLELKYKINADTNIQMQIRFLECVDSFSGITFQTHPKYDLAIVKFNDFKSLRYAKYAVFKKNTEEIRQGEYLCRLGFPFPEFTNFTFNERTDEIEWTNTGVVYSPRFPFEGMITRFLADEQNIHGIEMSTPGLRGQSGGPLFNKDGIVYGMQSSTKHLHLGFDIVDLEMVINNKIKTISDHPFIHLGQCIHANVIKAFLREQKVPFYEE